MAVSARQLIEQHIPLEAAIKGGFVFYGGLLGGALGLIIYIRQFHMKLSGFAELYTTVLPLGHAFGRVGCFFAGCCYGIPWNHGYTYHTAVGATPLGVPLLPIQLIEAGILLALFAVQMITLLRRPRAYRNTVTYFAAYPTLRFVLEFFRGDSERGRLLWLSTSQWVSLIILVALALILVRRRAKTSR